MYKMVRFHYFNHTGRCITRRKCLDAINGSFYHDALAILRRDPRFPLTVDDICDCKSAAVDETGEILFDENGAIKLNPEGCSSCNIAKVQDINGSWVSMKYVGVQCTKCTEGKKLNSSGICSESQDSPSTSMSTTTEALLNNYSCINDLNCDACGVNRGIQNSLPIFMIRNQNLCSLHGLHEWIIFKRWSVYYIRSLYQVWIIAIWCIDEWTHLCDGNMHT